MTAPCRRADWLYKFNLAPALFEQVEHPHVIHLFIVVVLAAIDYHLVAINDRRVPSSWAGLISFYLDAVPGKRAEVHRMHFVGSVPIIEATEHNHLATMHNSCMLIQAVGRYIGHRFRFDHAPRELRQIEAKDFGIVREVVTASKHVHFVSVNNA